MEIRRTQTGITVDQARRAVAAHLRAERARMDLTQTQFAERTGLSTNTIRRMENCERAMTLDQLVAISGLLGVSPGAFLDAAQASLRE
ncbi:helix-turn-helix domain-containing protein [Nocardia sp. NPDC059239]